jgi:DNA-binding NarL/FixJ family response regulator
VVSGSARGGGAVNASSRQAHAFERIKGAGRYIFLSGPSGPFAISVLNRLNRAPHCACATTVLLSVCHSYLFWVSNPVGCGVQIRVDGDFLGSSIRVLIVDDDEPFRQFLRSTLQDKLEMQITGEASDGEDAIALAQALQPDLILLDIGLPKLNGIEAARRIRELAPRSKIIFCSQESSVDIVEAAFSAGASGYVVKVDAGSELPKAVKAVLQGERYVGSRFTGHSFTPALGLRTPSSTQDDKIVRPLQPQDQEIRCWHEAGFYSDDQGFLDDVTQFIGSALEAGNPVIAVATQAHRDSLLPRLEARGLDIAAAIEQGRYISLDAAEALSTFMINDVLDPGRFSKFFGNLIETAAQVVKGEQARVAFFGEGAPLLWAQGHAEAAIQVEELSQQLAKTYDVDILCGYSLGSVLGEMDSQIFQRICAEHSAVHSR